MEGKDKMFATKWDSFCKYVGWRKTKRNIGTNVKKWDWYRSKDCRDVNNYKLLAFSQPWKCCYTICKWSGKK